MWPDLRKPFRLTFAANGLNFPCAVADMWRTPWTDDGLSHFTDRVKFEFCSGTHFVVRTYAGTLGFLAFFVTTVRGVFANGAIEAVLWTACCHLVILPPWDVSSPGWRSRPSTDRSTAKSPTNWPAGKRPRGPPRFPKRY